MPLKGTSLRILRLSAAHFTRLAKMREVQMGSSRSPENLTWISSKEADTAQIRAIAMVLTLRHPSNLPPAQRDAASRSTVSMLLEANELCGGVEVACRTCRRAKDWPSSVSTGLAR